MQRFVVGITGASGVHLGAKFAAYLARFAPQSEIFAVISEGAKMVIKHESCEKDLLKSLKNHAKIFSDSRLDSPIASGSFGINATAIIPCSANSLAKIAHGICDTLITRAAFVALKEREILLLAPREMPLNATILQNMQTLATQGAIIAPPMFSYYAECESVAQMEDFICGKWLDSLKIKHNLYTRWGESRHFLEAIEAI